MVFVSVHKLHAFNREVSRQLAAELCDTADRALTPFGAKADHLRELSAFVAARRL